MIAALLTFLFGAVRLFVPRPSVEPSLLGTYEAFAHIFVGGLIVKCYDRMVQNSYRILCCEKVRPNYYGWFALIISIEELILFFAYRA